MMMELLIAAAFACEDSKEVVESIMKSQQTTLIKHELIEVIKTNTETGCYEGSERNS